jgi:hypothetical protein
VASELILLGSHRRWYLLGAGAALMLLAFGVSLYLSLRGNNERPRPRWFFWAIGGVAMCYLVVAGTAWVVLGPTWALAAFAAGIIPMTAVSLLLATVRAKTAGTSSGLRDVSGDASDPLPGMGLDDQSPFGETSEHSDALYDPESAESLQERGPRSQSRR